MTILPEEGFREKGWEKAFSISDMRARVYTGTEACATRKKGLVGFVSLHPPYVTTQGFVYWLFLIFFFTLLALSCA